MTKQELSQLRYIKKEIELLQKQIADAEYAVETHKAFDFVEGSNSKWPYQRKKFYIEGVAVPEYEKRVKQLRKKLQRRLEELTEKREELEEYISTVPDSMMRMILTLRYVNGLSWKQVAAHVGGGNTADSVRKMCSRFFEKKR